MTNRIERIVTFGPIADMLRGIIKSVNETIDRVGGAVADDESKEGEQRTSGVRIAVSLGTVLALLSAALLFAEGANL